MKVNLYDYVKYTTRSHGNGIGIITYIGKYEYTVLSLKTGNTFSYMMHEVLPRIGNLPMITSMNELQDKYPELFI